MAQAASNNLDDLRQAWKAAHLVPLWESPTAHKPPAPPDRTHLWQWADVRPLIAGAIDITDPHAVERRVLQLVNPHPRNADDEATARTLAAALQILLPGETARPHRHSMNALRFVRPRWTSARPRTTRRCASNAEPATIASAMTPKVAPARPR